MKYLFYGIIGVAAVVLLSTRAFDTKQPVTNKTETLWETKADNQTPVAVTVTPTELGKELPEWRFRVVFDTHSGSLDDDPLAVVTLVDDKENIYWPISWDGPGPGGHHREGMLTFNAVQPTPKSVEIKIKNVGGIQERSFSWSLNR